VHRLAAIIALASLAVAACGCDSDAGPVSDPATTDSVAAAEDSVATADDGVSDAADDTIAEDAIAGDTTVEGGDSSDEGSEPTSSDEELCGALSAIVDLNTDMGLAMQPLEAKIVAEGPDAPIADEAAAVADEMEAGRETIQESYADAVDAASGDLRAALEVLADTTPQLITPLVDVFRDAEQAVDLDRIETVFQDEEIQQAAIDGGQAALEVDEFAIPNCGFRFSNT